MKMVLGLTDLQRFAKERTSISNLITEGSCVSRFAQPHLTTRVEGPVLIIRVWDLDSNNPVCERDIHLQSHNVTRCEVVKGTKYVSPVRMYGEYVTLTYELTLNDKAGYVVWRNRDEGDETVFVSWSAHGEDGRVFSDRQNNKVRWCDGWHDYQWSYDIYKRTQRNATEADG